MTEELEEELTLLRELEDELVCCGEPARLGAVLEKLRQLRLARVREAIETMSLEPRGT